MNKKDNKDKVTHYKELLKPRTKKTVFITNGKITSVEEVKLTVNEK